MYVYNIYIGKANGLKNETNLAIVWGPQVTWDCGRANSMM
jgi:hypothetical protein